MPSELNSKKQSRAVQIKQYALAAINLYGVIQLDDFILVFNHYEKEVLTKEEALSTLELMSIIDVIDLSFKQEIIAHGQFDLNNSKDFAFVKELLLVQSNKSRYLPSKEEFLKYEDKDYFEPSKPLKILELFMRSNNLLIFESLRNITKDILETRKKIIMGVKISDYVQHFHKNGYRFKDEAQLDLFYDHIIWLHNNTRTYGNNGHTPIETADIYEKTHKIDH